MPDCPPLVTPAFDKAGSDRYDAFTENMGVGRLWDIANAANERSGAAAQAVFAMPAQTIRAAVEKLKIVRLVVRVDDGFGPDDDGLGPDDENLRAFEDREALWIDNAIADLERLTRGAGS